MAQRCQSVETLVSVEHIGRVRLGRACTGSNIVNKTGATDEFAAKVRVTHIKVQCTFTVEQSAEYFGHKELKVINSSFWRHKQCMTMTKISKPDFLS